MISNKSCYDEDMLEQAQQKQLKELSKNYFTCLREAFGVITFIYEQLAWLEQDNSGWENVSASLRGASILGNELLFLNRLIDVHRNDWEFIGKFPNPLIGYELGVVLAESLAICSTVDNPEKALDLPLVTPGRLDELYSAEIHRYLTALKISTPTPTPAQTDNVDINS